MNGIRFQAVPIPSAENKYLNLMWSVIDATFELMIAFFPALLWTYSFKGPGAFEK